MSAPTTWTAELTWTDATGRRWRIPEMNTGHLMNAVRYIEENHLGYDDVKAAMIRELRQRGVSVHSTTEFDIDPLAEQLLEEQSERFLEMARENRALEEKLKQAVREAKAVPERLRERARNILESERLCAVREGKGSCPICQDNFRALAQSLATG
jgi:hypothetical protein